MPVGWETRNDDGDKEIHSNENCVKNQNCDESASPVQQIQRIPLNPLI